MCVLRVFSTSLSHVGNPGCLTWVTHSRRQCNTTTHPYHCVQYFHVSKLAMVWLPVLGIFTVHTYVDAC